MKVVLTLEARRDLESISDYIAEDSPAAARKPVRSLAAKAREIGEQPGAWPIVPAFEASGVHRRVAGSYIIFYRIEPSAVSIVHIVHGARDYRALLSNDA